MATETTVPMDDTGMLSSIMSEEREPAAPAVEPDPKPEPEAEPAPQERPRDEHGRFVAKQPETPVAEAPQAPEQTPEPKDDAHVPSWRLREVREAREAAERRAEEASRNAYALQQQMADMRRQLEALQKPKAEPVDFFQNPDQAFEQRVTPIQNEIQQFKRDMVLDFSRELAVVKYGEPAVTEMEQAVAKAMQSNHPDMQFLAMRMNSSRNPVSVAMDWYKNQKLVEATGGDPEKYKQRITDDLLKDPAFLAKAVDAARAQAGQKSTPSVQLPPSLNRAPGSGVSASELDDGDMSDAALFKHAAAQNKARR